MTPSILNSQDQNFQDLEASIKTPELNGQLQGRTIKYGCCPKKSRLASSIFITCFIAGGMVVNNFGADYKISVMRSTGLAVESLGVLCLIFYFFLFKNYRDSPPD